MHQFIKYLTLFATFAFACGCESNAICPGDASATVSFNPVPEEDNWLSLPFPIDLPNEDGNPNWENYPNPFKVGLLDDYIKVATRDSDGYSLNGAVYFSFSSPLNTARLPSSHASASIEQLALIDIDPDSDEYGRLFPVRWEYWAADLAYVKANTLAVAPHWGFPLNESTTYAMIIRDGLTSTTGETFKAEPALGALLSDAGADACGQSMPQSTYDDLNEGFALLRNYLNQTSIDPATVIAATVFTTQSTTRELKQIYDQVQTASAPIYQGDQWQPMDDAGNKFETKSFKWNSRDTTEYYLMEGRLTIPNYQVGDVPYNRDGQLQFIDGEPVVAQDETIRFTLAIPKTQEPAANGCFPITEYAHGTGGSAYSMVPETSGRLAARGIATIGIDMPIHGTRNDNSNFDVDIATFNFANPDSARSIFRQAAIDTWALTRFIQDSLKVDAANSPTGNEICFNTEKIGFFGHSQGGISGALALAFEEDINSWILSGAGGGLSITILERKDPVDFEEIIRFLTEVPAEEELTELHPLLTLIQAAVDITDPINYAPRWNPRRLTSPQNIMVTSGCYDEQTPHRSATAMAIAGRVPLVEPSAMESELYDLAGLPSVNAPVINNVEETATAGFLQWCGSVTQPNKSNHFLIFNNAEAIHASTEFLKTGLTESEAVIERDPNADVK